MVAEELISDHIIPLKRGDLCEAACGFMMDEKVTEMPVVEQNKLIGYLHLNKADKAKNKTVGEAMDGNTFFVFDTTHLFDVTKIMNEYGVSTIAVCDAEQNYKGAIALADVLKGYSKDAANNLPGAIVTMEITPRDYTLTEIARISETNDFKVIGIFIKSLTENKLEVSLKFNSTEINTVLHAFERFGYQIKTVHQLSQVKGGMDNRFDWLIKYINT
jgi:acetoin utilization protein AcuB